MALRTPKKTTLPTEPILGTTFTDDGPILTVSATPPTVSTDGITSITTNSATCGGNVTAIGSATSVVARGVCWSTSTIPNTPSSPIPSTKTVNGSGLGIYVSNISGLTPGTLYYVSAYATGNVSNDNGFGSERTFTTSAANPPTVTTDTITSISYTTAIGGGNVTNSGSTTVTIRGIVWNTTLNPTTSSYVGITYDSSGTGTFVSNLSSLSQGTLYHVRAYATNSIGTSYGSDVTFTTPLDLAGKISINLSVEAVALSTAVAIDFTNQTTTLISAISTVISTTDDSLAAQISTQLANRHII